MPRAIDGISPEKTPTKPTPPAQLVGHQQRPHRQRQWPRWVKKLVYLLGCLLLLMLVLYIYNYRSIVGAWSNAQNGQLSLESGIKNVLSQPKTAQRDFIRAEGFFTASATSLKKLDLLSKAIFTLPTARNQLALLKLGHSAASSGEIIARLLEDPPPKAAGDFAQTIGSATSWLNSWQTKNQDNLAQLLVNLRSMESVSQQTSLKDTLPQLTRNGQSLLEILRQSPDLFGSRGDRRYMIIFQNNTELRPTGGFIGSYATLLFRTDGTAAFIFGPNIYHATPDLTTWQPITPPHPVINDTAYGLTLREANWDADFPTTSELLLKFYESIHGASAQGVIALDTSLITDILGVTGPVEFPAYNTTLTADNFLEVVQYKVEREYFQSAANVKENEPKKILADFIPVLFGRLSTLDQTKKAELLTTLGRAFKRKTIQIYSQNKQVEQALADLDVDGRLKASPSDYLYINNANIAGWKSSLNVKQEIELTQIIRGQHIQNTLRITRTHTGDGQWPDGDNRNYMRLYVPRGSTLIKASGGFEEARVYEEHNRTVIAGWYNTPAADKQQAEIVYQLPSEIKKSGYSLLLQRQPGDRPSTYRLKSPLLGTSTFDLDYDTNITHK
jgi:hypothetical protein